MTASISGVLIGYAVEDHPAWVPHRTVTHAVALKALEMHLQRDCISTGDIFHSNRISGNFFLASAGFCIEDATDTEWKRAREMLRVYEASAHRQIYARLEALYKKQDDRIAKRMSEALAARVQDYERQRIPGAVRATFNGEIRPLEAQLESIYREKDPAREPR